MATWECSAMLPFATFLEPCVLLSLPCFYHAHVSLCSTDRFTPRTSSRTLWYIYCPLPTVLPDIYQITLDSFGHGMSPAWIKLVLVPCVSLSVLGIHLDI